MIMDRMTQFRQDISSSQTDLQIQCNPNQNFGMLFCGHCQNYSKVPMESQKTQIGQYNIEGEKHSGRTDTTDFKNLFQWYSHQGSLSWQKNKEIDS